MIGRKPSGRPLGFPVAACCTDARGVHAATHLCHQYVIDLMLPPWCIRPVRVAVRGAVVQPRQELEGARRQLLRGDACIRARVRLKARVIRVL
jgi:hypothetical protein